MAQINNPRPKLTRQQWDELYEQFSVTPNPNEGFSDTGEHWKLIALLNKLGHTPFGRYEAVDLAQALLDEGWEDVDRLEN